MIRILLPLSLLVAAPATARTDLTGGDACTLVERLPGADAPVRAQKPVVRAFRALDRAGSDREKMGRAHDRFERAVGELLDRAREVFHPGDGGDWGDDDRLRAKRFLERHVLGEHPILRVGQAGFEPRPGIRAALMWTACRAGRREAAVRWGRRATPEDEGPARAFAALLLLEDGRDEEAGELLPDLTGDSFVVSWVRAELEGEPEARRGHHDRAERRTTTHDQHEAIAAQRKRLESRPSPPPEPPSEGGEPPSEGEEPPSEGEEPP